MSMAGDAGGEMMKEWLSAVQITQGLTECLEEEEDEETAFGFNVHHRRSYPYESHDVYPHSDSEDWDSEPEDHHWSSSASEEEDIRERFPKRLRTRDEYQQDTDQYSEEQDTDESMPLPDWFLDQPFQHSGKIFLISIPGMLLLLTLGGDMFITIATMGSLGVYLFHSAGNYGRAMTCYLITFICLQLTIIYSVLPLLWKSSFNLVLVICVNIYSCLMGAWILLAFQSFRVREPRLTVVIETALFSLYPALCVMLIVFLLATVTSAMMAPYSLLVIGFPVLQSFLSPTASSFKKAESGKPENALIMQPYETAIGVLLYTASAPILYILCAFGTQQIFEIGLLVEVLFMTCLSMVLASCFDMEQFMQENGVSVKLKQYLTAACGGVVMVAVPLVLHRHGVHSHLLPWLPLGLLLHTALVYSVHTKSSKNAVYGCGIAVLLFYVIIFVQLPWGSNYEPAGGLPLYALFALLFVDVLLCLLCVFCYVSRSQQAFGLALVCQTLGVVVTMKLLESWDLVNFGMSVCLAAGAVYLLLRLYYNEKVTMAHACACIALHITTALTYLPSSSLALGPATPDMAPSAGDGFLWATVEFFVLFLLEVAMCRIMIFQQDAIKELSRNEFVKLVAEVLVLAVFNAPLWLSRLLSSVARAEPGVVEYLATILVLGAIISSKLYFNTECDWSSAKYVAPSMFMSAILITVVEPQLSFTWENLLKWMFLMSLITCILITRLMNHLKKSFLSLIIISAASGFPLGFALTGMVFPHAFIAVHFANSILATVLVVIVVLIWLETINMEERVTNAIYSLTALLVVAMITQECVFKGTMSMAMEISCCFVKSSLFAASLVLAIVFKLHSLRRQSMQFTKEGLIQISKLPLLGNLCTVVAVVSFWFVSPWQQEFSVYLSACLLILLQRDHYVLKQHSSQNNLTPTIAAIYSLLVIATCYHSNVWLAKRWWPWILGFIEVSMGLFTVPVIHICTTVLWSDTIYLSDRTVVFLTPLYSVLVPVASSYTCWGLAAVGLFTGWWLMSYKLLLER